MVKLQHTTSTSPERGSKYDDDDVIELPSFVLTKLSINFKTQNRFALIYEIKF